MLVFFENIILWTLALYGLFEIIENLFYYSTYQKKNNKKAIDIIILAKNQEENIEGLVRELLFNKKDKIEKIILTDLSSKDNTKEIMQKISKDFDNITFTEKFNFKDA